MANIRRWMAEARAREEAGDLRGAVALHQKALAAQEETAGFADLGLYNGLGDLYLRSGDVSRAVAAFEKAAEVCEDQQLYTNGIALCKKILRNAPERAGAHRRAGRLLAASGLRAEARAHYEEYVELVDHAGRPDRAEEALAELVSLTGDEVACLTLADRLADSGRTDRALRMLRETRRRREEEGLDVVAIVRRIQEVQATSHRNPDRDGSTASGADERPAEAARTERVRDGASGGAGRAALERTGPAPSAEADASRPRASARREPSSGRTGGALPARSGPPATAKDDVGGLIRELEAAFAIGDEDATVEAYLALGGVLDRRLRRFSVRALSSSSASGDGTTAVEVGPRSEEAGTGS